jgi:hypothetical protein
MEDRLSGSWAASMRTAFAATMAHPAWWVMALAAFLVRGGFVVVLLPLVSLPSVPSLATTLAPPLEALVLSRQSLEGALVGTVLVTTIAGLLAAAGFAGSWLDLALLREAAGPEELDGTARLVNRSAWHALGVRVAAHLPTFLALGYATVRLVIVTYSELLSPGDSTVPLVSRVIAQAPDAAVLVVVTWLLGEAVGGLASRRSAAGEPVIRALRGAVRDLLGPRGVSTFLVSTGVVLVAAALLVTLVGRASEHLRAYLLDGVSDVSLAASLLLLVSAWILCLALLAAALAWRATAWTIEAGTPTVARDPTIAVRSEEAPIA